MQAVVFVVVFLANLHPASGCIGRITNDEPPVVAATPNPLDRQPEWGTTPNAGVGCAYGAPLKEDACVQLDPPTYDEVKAPKLGTCPTPLVELLPSELSKVAAADLRACTERDTRYLTYAQNDAIAESILMEWARSDPTKLATVGLTAEQDQIEQVNWEWVAQSMSADSVNAMSPTAISKLPFERILPYMPASEVANVNPAVFISSVPSNKVDDFPWELLGSSMTESQVRSLSPQLLGTNDQVPWDRMMPYMSTDAVEAISQDQWKAMPPSAFSGLDQRTFGTLSADTLNEVTTYQLQSIRPDNWQALRPSSSTLIDSSKFAELPVQSLRWIDPDTIGVLDADAFDAMGPAKFADLFPKQMSAIDPFVMQEIAPSTLRQLTAAQSTDLGINNGQFLPPGLFEDGLGFGNNKA